MNLAQQLEEEEISGTTHIILSKVDILENVNYYSLIFNKEIVVFSNIEEMKNSINKILKEKCNLLNHIIYSDSPQNITEL